MEATNNHNTNNNKHNASEGICVGIRCRPLNDRELNNGQDKIFKCHKERNAISQVKDNQPVEGQTYYYDKVFDETSTTVEVYTHIGKDIVNGVMNGINGTIFAYGQTSSGKTHTMLGGGDQAGVLNMAAQDIFNHIERHPNRDFLLRASFVEIYNENIRDLFSDSSDANVAIREDPRRGVYCEAIEIMISSYDSICKALKTGIAKRAVEATAMNDTSSRSHTIFKLVIESKESSRNGFEGEGAVLVGTLNLVDLAGSESVKHTGAIGQRAKEGGKINQSLLSLSRVIHALSQPNAHVSFRDSKLTRLLQPSLSGNAKMSIVCCITPASHYLEETRSTLQFASRAKLVETHATVNEVLDESAQIRRLKKELDELKTSFTTKVKTLEEENALKDLKILELSSIIPSIESKEDMNGYDNEKESRKRTRIDSNIILSPEIPRSKESIKDTLLQLHTRRAQGLITLLKGSIQMDVRDDVASDISILQKGSVTTNKTSTTSVANTDTADKGSASITINPQTFVRHNSLMKDLAEKIKARKVIDDDEDDTFHKSKKVLVHTTNSMNAIDKNATLVIEQNDMIIQLTNELKELKDVLATKDVIVQDLTNEKEELINQLELEMGANAEYVQEQKELFSHQENKLVESHSIIESLQIELDSFKKIYEDEKVTMLELYETLKNDSSFQIQENEKMIQTLKEENALLSSNTTSSNDSELLMQANQLLNDTIIQLELKLVELNDNNQQKSLTIENILQSLKDSQEKCTEPQVQIDLLNQQYIESSESIIQLKDEINVLQQNKIDLISQIELNQETFNDLENIMKTEMNYMKDTINELQFKNVQSSDMIIQLKEEVIQLNQIINELKNELEIASSSIATNESNYTTNLNVLQDTINKLQQELIFKSNSDSEYENLSMKVYDLTASLEDSNNQIISFKDKVTMLDSITLDQSQQIEQLKKDISDSKANETMNNDLLIDLEAMLEQSKNDHENAENTIKSLNAAIKELNVKHTEVMQQLKSEYEENKNQLQIHINSLEVEINDLKTSLEQSHEEYQQLTSKLDEVLSNNLSTTTATGTISRLNEVDLSQECLDQARKDMEKQLASMTSELGNKDAVITKLMNSMTELNERIMIADQRLNIYDNNNHDSDELFMKKKMNQLQTNVDLLTNEKENLLLKLQNLESEIKSNNNQSIRKIESLETLCNEQVQIISKLTLDSNNTIIELKNEINEVIIQRDNCERRLEIANKKIDTLTYDIEQLQNMISLKDTNNNNNLNEESSNMADLLQEKQQLQEDLLELSNRLKKSHEESKKMRELWEESENLKQCSEDESKLLKEELDQALLNVEQLTIALEEATLEAEKLPTIMEENSMDSEAIATLESEIEQLKQNKIDLQQEMQDNLHVIELNNLKINELMNEINNLQVNSNIIENDLIQSKQQVCELENSLQTESDLKTELQNENSNLLEKDMLNSVCISNLELKVNELETDSIAIKQKLQESINSNEESESKISSLHQLINEKELQLSDLFKEISLLNDQKENLSIEINDLRIDNKDKDSMIHTLQDKIQNTLLDDNNKHEDTITQLQVEKEIISKEILTLKQELQAANEHCAMNQEMLTTLQEQIDVKDKRIEHLEACKLTKEQMEKIKVIKEERKKYQEDSKTLKKQLQQLTIKFDELRTSKLNNSSNGVTGGGPSTDYIISDYKVQLVTTSQQLVQSQEEVKLIKSKLKECAVQLKEYETDHMKVVAVLEKYEIDTRGLLPLEHSIDEDSSIQHGDISDAVGQLGEKFDTMKAMVTRKEIAKTQKVIDLENQVSNYTLEIEDLKVQKQSLEKRLEQLKNAAKLSREQNATMTIQIEELNEKIIELKDLLNQTEKRVVNSSDVVSSEIQALEEENIDLLKENKELRMEVSRFRSMGSISMAQKIPSTSTIFVDPQVSVVNSNASPLVSQQSCTSMSGHKRTFGTDLSNTTNVVIHDDKAISKKPFIANDNNHIDDGTTTTATNNNDMNKATRNGRNTRIKAKALVDGNLSQTEEKAGECNQS